MRWCPGCGDYAILNAVQGFMPELGIPREKIVFVSGIGCAARFPYYMETYGMHSIHGRAPAIATGLATARPDLSVWVIGGDGDMLSIGGNHLIHALRRNVNLTILLLNNQIYGLTKGQYSPTSERGKVTKSTPMGSVDQPFNPLSVAIGAEATFVARAIDTDKKELTEVLRAAAAHRGASFVEVFQNCNIYNDGAFDFVREQKENRIYLKAGEPIVFGDRGVRQAADGSAEVVDAAAGGLLVHDPVARRAERRVRAVAADVRHRRRDAVRRLPLGRRGPSTTRRSPTRSASRRSSAAKATSRRCSTPATPGRSGERASLGARLKPGAALERRRLRCEPYDGRVSTSTETIDSGLSIRSPTSGHSPRGLLDLGDHGAGEHEGAVAIRRRPELQDLAVAHADDDPTELRGRPLGGAVEGRAGGCSIRATASSRGSGVRSAARLLSTRVIADPGPRPSPSNRAIRGAARRSRRSRRGG